MAAKLVQERRALLKYVLQVGWLPQQRSNTSQEPHHFAGPA